MQNYERRDLMVNDENTAKVYELGLCGEELTRRHHILLYMGNFACEEDLRAYRKAACRKLELWAVLHAIDAARIHSRYSNLIRDIYEHATLRFKAGEDLITRGFPLKHELDKAILSKKKSINPIGKFLSHPRFTDDIVLVSGDDGFGLMLRELREESVGLPMNPQKTKIVSQDENQVRLDNHTLVVVEKCAKN
ncbi:hypothetical protein HUJ04_010848 [Dendroctonus ponderosae]|nr:hypothetical protein HUJ04_010848 [Dendroctonus ponderosae]